jgi:GAF domain-containing protein
MVAPVTTDIGGLTKADLVVDYGMLHRELADLAVGLRSDSDLNEGLYRLSETAAASLELDGAGVTLQIPGATTGYVAAGDSVTLHVERRQDALHEGACVDAIASGQIVAIGDLNTEQPWPRFTPELLEAGLHACAGIPISFQGLNIGALNLYANDTRIWTTDEFAAGRLLAEMAAGYLINNELLRTTQTVVHQLQFALDSRIVIEQAKGVMAGRYGMTPDGAFEMMRGYARGQRVKLRDVASDIVNEGLDLLGASAENEDAAN